MASPLGKDVGTHRRSAIGRTPIWIGASASKTARYTGLPILFPRHCCGSVSTPKRREPTMPLIRCIAGVLVSAFAVGNADAAGLIHKLPADGTSAVFTVEQRATATFDGENVPYDGKGTMRVAVVGTQEVAGLKCRWIEVETRLEAGFGDEPMSQFEWWKFLIPERELVGPQQGVSMALRIYHTSDPDAEEPHLITGKEERRVTLRKIGAYFPASPTSANRINAIVKSQIAKTPAGDFECGCRVFDAYTDLYLIGPSRMQESAVYRVWTTEQCPLGVAAMEVQAISQTISPRDGGFADEDYRLNSSTFNSVTRLKLQRVEHDIESRFPEHD